MTRRASGSLADLPSRRAGEIDAPDFGPKHPKGQDFEGEYNF
jgi:hypothetical protein